MATVPLAGTIANVPADGSASSSVTFGTPFAAVPTVSVSVLNPTTWDGFQLSAAIIGTPTATGFSVLVSGGALGSTISVSWQASGTGSTYIPTVTTGSVPQGYSGASAVQMVRDNCDEPTLPDSPTILRFLNAGLQEVERRLNGIFVWSVYPTVANQTFVSLNNDLQYIQSCNFSSGASNTSGFISTSSPLAQGSLVYPMVQLEQATFMDAAAGFPAVGFGPPQAFFIYTDQGSSPTTTLPEPAAPVFAIQTGTSTVTIDAVVTYTSASGETTPSTNSVQAITTVQQAVALSPQGYSNATGYNVYVRNGSTYWLQNSTPVALGTPYIIPSTPLASGTAAPSTNTAIGSGAGGAMFMQLYPAAMIGQVNVYGRMRPKLWADTSTGSWTNLDSSLQEAALVWATYRVLRNRSRYDDARDWLNEFQGTDGESGLIGSMKESAMRRTRPPAGRVRNVTDRAFPDSPFFIT